MNRISGWSRTLLIALNLALVTLSPIFSAAHAGERKVVWETREGYVALAPRDTSGNVPVVPNNHPLEMSEDLLVGLLDSVQVRDSLKDKPTPLFTRGALQLLVPHLRQALRQAGPGEDVTFTVIALYKTLLGGNTPKATSGRLFYQGGKLNLIFGVVKDEGRSRLDALDRDFRLIAVGSRRSTASGEWLLVPGDDRTFEITRRDWVLFDPKATVTVKPAPVIVQPSPVTKKGGEVRPLAERLATLNELKKKGLITEEEYRAKRMQILSDL